MFFVDGTVGAEHPTCLIETFIDDVTLVFHRNDNFEVKTYFDLRIRKFQ